MDKVAYVMECFSSALWIGLAVIIFVRARQWDKRFRELDEELKEIMRDGTT